MATGKKFYWLKLSRDFFKRHDIRIIESQENGKDYILFYLKLLVESIDHEGQLRFSDTVPYDEKMLSIITNTNVDIVRQAIKIFSELKLMEICDDKTIYMSETAKMLGYEKKSTERVRVFREKQQLLEEKKIPYIETHTNNKRYGGYYYKVLQRDEYKCAECGSDDKICVHHIIPYDIEDDETVRMENLVTLCRTCHSKLHNNKPPFQLGELPIQEILDKIGFDETLQKRYRNVTKRYIDKEIDKEIEKDKELLKEKDKKEKTVAKRSLSFVKPTREEILNYCNERKNQVNPSQFYDFYESKNWMVGKNKMKDWKAAVRTWEQRTNNATTTYKKSTRPDVKPEWFDEYVQENGGY